ncbi:MAG: sugar kinase, partial [Pyrinomonadaceae bacterium]
MRKINSHNFQIATRKTSREVNRKIILNLIRDRQPISRADLARLMKTTRSAVTSLVTQLIGEGEIYEGTTGETARGRKPIFLHTRTNHRLVMAIDVRYSRTYLMLSDLNGSPISIESFKTVFDPGELIQ